MISAPSGSGKTTLLNNLSRTNKNLKYSISYTTRAIRRGETNHKHYHFIDREKFIQLKNKNFFAEWALVYGNYYATAKKDIEKILSRGFDIVMDLDTKGARSIKKIFKNSVSIFVIPPTLGDLKKRLKMRNSDTKEEIEKRYGMALKEILKIPRYDYIVVNDTVAKASKRILSIIESEKRRVFRVLND